MNRRSLGQVMTAVGAILVFAGVVGVMSSDDGSGAAETSSPRGAAETTTTAESVSPSSSSTTIAADASARRRVEAFAADLDAAHEHGDDAALFERLHPAVLARYGADQCREYLRGVTGSLTGTEIQAVEGPVTIAYTTDGITDQIPDGYNVDAAFTLGGGAQTAEIHYADVDGELTWFTDCGTPA